MTSHNVLLVEGRDDKAVIGALLKHYQIETVTIEAKDGKDNILNEGKLLAYLTGSEVSVLGIVLDADNNLAGHWQSLCTILAKSSYGYILPQAPDPAGTILEFADPDGVPVGIWLMPDNQTSGILEDFAAQLVQDGDALWAYATDTLAALREQRFAAKDRSKAHIHTWLAWQDEPGKPLGQALLVTYLKAEQPTAVPFIDWIKQLFPEYVS